MLPLLLITDIDSGTTRGAMIYRAAFGIIQRQTMIIPGTVLVSMIIGCRFAKSNIGLQESREFYSEAFQEVSKGKWEFFRHKECDLVVLLPDPALHSLLQLEDYESLSFKFFDQEASKVIANIRYEGKRWSSEAIIKVLDTAVKKHIIWAGHGSLDKEAMGFTLEEVSGILSKQKSVENWNLHSCFILGNIKKILSQVEHRQSTIIINDGLVTTTFPLIKGEESLKIYFRHISQAESQVDIKTVHVFEKLAPWVSGLDLINHPFIILKETHQLIPLSFISISENYNESGVEKKTYTGIHRLFLGRLYIKQPLQLEDQIKLIPGTGEKSNLHFFEELITSSSLDNFINGLIASGDTLYLIKKLTTANGVYNNFIHYSHSREIDFMTNLTTSINPFNFLEKDLFSLNNPLTFYYEDNSWFTVSARSFWIPLKVNSIEEGLKNAIISTFPVNSDLKIEPFFEIVRSSFSLADDFIYHPKEILNNKVESTRIEKKERLTGVRNSLHKSIHI